MSTLRRILTMLATAGVLLAAVTTVAGAAPLAANTGTVQSLTVSGASTPGDPINISSSVQATSMIQLSNLYYELYSPTGTLLTTRKVSVSEMSDGDTFADSWSYSNPPETGDYRVTLCWSTGNAQNCDIASAETTFYSVPTLGVGLTIVALLLVAALLARDHKFRLAVVR